MHRDLHSFPTRRSSDLVALRMAWSSQLGSSGPPTASAAPWAKAAGLAGRCCPRSEEHTSELQSHSDLVCRLLLEKKNLSAYDALAFVVIQKYRSTIQLA